MFRVLSAQIAHETNTFSLKRTTLDDYRSRALYFGAGVRAAFQNTNTEIGAHLSAAARFGWHLVQPIACSATPSGPTSAPVWHRLRDTVLDGASTDRFDGAVIALHGAMVSEDEDDAEGALLEGLRQRLGLDIPIVVTVDLHANISDRMARNCNGLLAYKTYPHVDQRDVAHQACCLLQLLMETRERTAVHVWRLPTLVGCDFGRTDGAVMPVLLRLCSSILESDQRCKALEVCAGFPWSDVSFAGPSVAMTFSGSDWPQYELAQPVLHAIWDTRKSSSADYATVREAVEIAKSWDRPQPLVLADVADNPGAGGYGDSVLLLRELIRSNVDGVAVATVADPAAAAAAIAAGPGATIDLRLGGIFEPAKYGGPIECNALIVRISDGSLKLSGPVMNGLELSLGPTAVVKIGGILVVVATNNMQVFDRSFFLSLDIDPYASRVLVVKSSHHFRSDFDEIAGKILLVDASGPVSPDLKSLNYLKLRRPIEPLETAEWGPK